MACGSAFRKLGSRPSVGLSLRTVPLPWPLPTLVPSPLTIASNDCFQLKQAQWFPGRRIQACVHCNCSSPTRIHHLMPACLSPFVLHPSFPYARPVQQRASQARHSSLCPFAYTQTCSLSLCFKRKISSLKPSPALHSVHYIFPK